MVTGNRNILNSIKGITSVVKLTAEEKTALADRVLPANVLVVDSSNIVYLTDGVTAIKALGPLLASSNNYAYDKDVVHLTGDETIAGTKTFSAAIVGSVTGDAGSATKLATARTINGTSFNGTANITTANWGTARNISITDGTNTSTAVSVNGSANVSLTLPATIKATFVGNITGNVTGNATSATKLQTARSLWGNNFDGSQNLSGDIHFTNDDLTGVVVGARGQVGDNDYWRVGGGTTAHNSGFMELATADDGNEPIYVRQYAGVYATITRTATLLDASGNTQFPGTVTATAFYGNITGNASSATKLAAKRTIALSGAATGTATGFDGTANIAIPVTSLDASKLTGTASVSTTGNAATATNATNSNAANQLQAFVNDNFTSGNHYVKAIRSSQGWSTHLWMCYNNGAKMADEVSVNYANSAGSANTANSATNANYASRSTNNGGFYINNYLVTIG